MSKKLEKKWKNAVWQYLIDHSKKTHTGMFSISFIMKDEHTFWQRVRARRQGYFKRTDLHEEQTKLENMRSFTKDQLFKKKLQDRYNAKRSQAFKLFEQSDDPNDIKCREQLKPLITYRKQRISELIKQQK